MNKIKRLVAAVLLLAMLIMTFPVSAFENTAILEAKNEEELRSAVLGDEKWVEQFPNGLFNFVGTQYQIHENQKYQEIAIARQGGTAGEVSVDFKTLDVTAEYGKDYVIRVYENNKKAEIAKDENSVPLINSLENGETNISAYPENENANASAAKVADTNGLVPVKETVADNTYVSAEADVNGNVNDYINTEKADENGNVNDYTTLEKTKNGGSLRDVRDAYVGSESDRKGWKTADKGTTENLKQGYDEVFTNLPGAKATITFADGEYIKYFYVVPLNDKISEDEEQFMFTLENPTNATARGEFYMGYVNIADDEEFEISKYSFSQSEVTADGKIAYAHVKREGGIYHYSTITVGTIADTATEDRDYVAGLTDIKFAPGVSEMTISVDIIPNIYRTESRSFYLALTGESEKIDTEKAQCFVTIPKAENSMTPYEYNKSVKSGSLATSEKNMSTFATNSAAEKISEYGFSDKVGDWVVSANDMYNGGFSAGGWLDGDTVKFDHTGGGQFRHTNKVKLFGTQAIEAGYYNAGRGHHWSGDYKWTHCWDCFAYKRKHKWFACEHNFGVDFEIDYNNNVGNRKVAKSTGEVGWTVLSSGNLRREQWNNNWMGFYSWAADNNHTAAACYGIRMTLKPYNVNMITADNFDITTYNMNPNSLSKSNANAYSPGSISIKSIGSNVGNSKDLPGSGTVAYRSDKINLSVNYSAENPNGKYSYYDGFMLNGVRYSGTTIDLTEDFFRKQNLYDTTKLDIKPIFTRRRADFAINVNTKNGHCTNLGTTNSGKNYGTINLGDVVQNVEAKNKNAAMLPQWDGKSGNSSLFANQGAISPVESFDNIITKINYTLDDRYNQLYLSFSNPELIVKANPNIYAEGFTRPLYVVDNVQYDMSNNASKTAYFDKMKTVFDGGQNPNIQMSFQYKFDENYGVGEVSSNTDAKIISDRKEKFGNPTKAEVKIYNSVGTLKKTHAILPSNGNDFVLSGTLSDLGCSRGDFATITIYGTRLVNGAPLQTRETIIDFLENSAAGVIVKAPNGAIAGGDVHTPVNVRNANPVEQYDMQAFPAPGFVTKWADYSTDLNNDGNETPYEKDKVAKKLKLLGYELNKEAYDPTLYWGNAFFKKPSHIDPTKIFYNFEKTQNETANFDIAIRVKKTASTVLDPGVLMDPEPVKNATVVLVDKEITDISDGIVDGTYYSRDSMYKERNNYMCQIYLHPYTYNFPAVAGTTVERIINTSEIMRPVDFYANVNGTFADLSDSTKRSVSLAEGNTSFSYGFDYKKAGVMPNDSIIRIYNTNGDVTQTYKTGKPDDSCVFTYNINNTLANIKPGSTMTIAGVYTDGNVTQEYPEVEVGLRFKRDLTVLNIAASFKTPIQPIISLFGQINSDYDLGLDLNVQNKFKTVNFVDKNNKERIFSTLSFGFNKEFEKEIGAAEPEPEDKNGDGKPDELPKGNKVADGTLVKSLEDTTGKPGENKGKVKESADKVKPNAETDAKPVEKQTGSGSLSATFGISLSIILEEGRTAKGAYDGENYFSALILMAEATVQGGYQYTYVTPIGIPVMASIEAGGYVSAMLSTNALASDPFNERYKLGGNGTIEFNSDNYSIYGRFVIQPYLTVGAGVGFKFLNVWLYGNAKFDMEFNVPISSATVSSSGSGTMNVSAEVAVKVLFIQKHWNLYNSDTINMFSYGRSSFENALNNPYNDYLYQELGEIKDQDIMPRDYLKGASEYGNYLTNSNTNSGANLSLYGASQSEENVLKIGAYPYPETKMLDLGNGKTLMLFIEDDAARDAKNRSRLMYTIGNGNTYDIAKPVSDDGTFDESPDAFIVEDKVFITWSNADKKFTNESEKEVLSSMNISAKWYDIATGQLSDTETVITKTTVGTVSDRCADIEPMISYDEHSKRLLVYYTKIDYDSAPFVTDTNISGDTIPEDELPKNEKDLYGDIVNGYSVIAYRYADQQLDGSFIWSDTYAPEESFNTDMATAYYGQRFLDLAVRTKITETETEVAQPSDLGSDGQPIPPIVITDENGAIVTPTVKGTTQTVAAIAGTTDPRVVDSDLITYNGLALFAYTIDFDGNIKTENDQKLFMQIYNFAEKSFHHPIQLTNKDDQNNAKPKFVRTKNVTYLYWIQDGNVVYMNITKIVNNGLKEQKVTIDGAETSLYVLDKTYTTIDGYENVAIKRGVDNPIGEFDIKSNGDGNVLLWTEYGISYKNGIKPGEVGSDDPNNIIKEKQIYASYTEPEFGYVYEPLTTGYPLGTAPMFEFIYNGDTAKYPAQYKKLIDETNGQPIANPVAENIDYGAFPDVNGSVGLVHAGDPIMLKKESAVGGYKWSTPIKLTNEVGANYSDISFILTDVGKIKASYIKYTQSLDANSTFTDDENLRKLATCEFVVTSDLTFSDVVFEGDVKPQAGQYLASYSNVTNTGYLPVTDTMYQTYMVENGVEKVVTDWIAFDTILGGNTAKISENFLMPEPMSAVTVGFRLRNKAGIVIGEAKKDIKATADFEIVEHLKITENNTIKSQIFVKNIGNLPFNDVYKIICGDKILYSENINIGINEEKELNCEFSMGNVKFGGLLKAEDGSKTSTAALIYNFGGFNKNVDVIRKADAIDVKAAENIKSFTVLANEKAITEGSKVKLSTTKITPLKVEKMYHNTVDGGFDGTTVTYESSNPSVVSALPDGTLVPMDAGLSTITVTIKPESRKVNAYSDGTFEGVDTMYELPQELVKKFSFVANVPGKNSGGGGSSGGGSGSGSSGGKPIYVGGNVLTAKNNVAKTTVAALSTMDDLTVNGDATVVFDKNALDKIAETKGSSVEITVKKDDNKFHIAVTVDGKEITDFGSGEITLEFPRALNSGENGDNLVLYHTVDGKPVCMPFSKFKNGKMLLNTKEIGSYEIRSNTTVFTDVRAEDWFNKAVNFAAAREIIQGVGDNKFEPNSNITRADFLVMIMRGYSVSLQENVADGFADCGDEYFTDYINTAKEIGIVGGVGDNKFAPYESITRQDMSVMLYNLLNKLNKLNVLENPEKLMDFADNGEISEYAVEAMTYLVDQEILKGSENKLTPKNNTLRCEIAQIIYNLI